MACLNKLAIRGIRSFDDKQISVIEFFSPVTVIVGHNGSGKTTIIECLKYATTGDQPPNTRGGAFVHDPKMANEKEVKAQVKLRFHAANGTRMLAVRNLSVTVKKNAALTMKTLESVLGLADGNADDGKRSVISTKCAEIDAEIPQLLGVSKSVLENVIFCHQEDSYWPLAEPSILKKKFDDIFEATRYTKALTSIKDLRKERVQDLKAEQERLVGLLREKDHADKLKKKIKETNNIIATKEAEYEQTKKQHDALMETNQRFYDNATRFRELYVKVEALEQQKSRLQIDYNEAKLNVQDVAGTDAELDLRLKNFDEHINSQRQRKRTEDIRKQDLDDDLLNARNAHTELVQQRGILVAESEAQKKRISDRETLIHEISERHSIKGYNHSPLEAPKVIEFMSRLSEIQRKQRSEFERLQGDLQSKTEEYNRKTRQLDSEMQGFNLRKKSLREQITQKQSEISSSERSLAKQQSLSSDLQSLQSDIEAKKNRIAKIKADMVASSYDAKLVSKSEKVKDLEERREILNSEIRTLSLQADARAKLDLKRGEVKSKSTEIQNTLSLAKEKMSKLTKKAVTPDTMEQEVERLSMEKEQECLEQETTVTSANGALQKVETTLSSLTSQLKSKKDELKALDKKWSAEYLSEAPNLEEAIKVAIDEVDYSQTVLGNMLGGGAVYELLLKTGRQTKTCTACTRPLNGTELTKYEETLQDLMSKKAKPQNKASNEELLREWQGELQRLQNLRPVLAARERLRTTEIPALEDDIKSQEAAIPKAGTDVEQAMEKLSSLKRQLKEIATLKQYSEAISRLRRETDRAKQEIQTLETDLATTGSTRTADDVQIELDSISAELRTNEREKQTIISERDRNISAIRTFESDLHSMELQERDLANGVRENKALEERVQTMSAEITTFNTSLRELDAKIAEAQGPLDALESNYRQHQSELNAKISQAQQLSQQLNMSIDQLTQTNKAIERYVKERRARQLEECVAKVEEQDEELRKISGNLDAARDVIAKIDKEIHESGASIANLRENIRVRKLERDIKTTQAEIDKYDMEEAGKAKRNFEEKYAILKEKETTLQTSYSHIAGEVSSQKAHLKTLERDLLEFKDIYKRYTDQLIKVKMSDMANSDLEKYGKALENAIMKYHGLKMEEVNDTMKHLWNKTYQGTDIDGIKIRSDVEGAANKRSYNYRVVMTKDQVEMDMRGRCSAGQKMLASIIIRLALSDSFGQNCGILALDEPTNALDTENIDALAASLVDIINERKNHSNFQLIIITHDENFLRKLGQSDVMEYYWRVSRDSRQKSVIERQRFR